MFRRLLVTLDGTAQAAAALSVARSLAVATGAAVFLVHVLPPALTSADQLRAAAQQNLQHIADELGADIIVMTSHAQEPPSTVAVSSLASQILRVARQPVLLIRHEVLRRTPAPQFVQPGVA